MQRTSEVTWEKPKCIGDVPSARSGHTFTNIDDFAYLFGGCAINQQTSLPSTTSEIYKLDMTSESAFYWSKLNTSERSSEEPCPRWYHSAICYGSSRICVFGGLTGNNDQPTLNDVWVLDTEKDVWLTRRDLEHCNRSADEKECVIASKGTFSKCETPSPRGSHSAALVDDMYMLIFGGYGGEGYAQFDLNDLYALCLNTWNWYSIETLGTKPAPRSGHKSIYFHGSFYVMGGWSSIETFDDLYILDTLTWSWSKPENGSGPDAWGAKRWNLAAVSAYSVPDCKIFIFGGKSGDLGHNQPQAYYLNDIQVLETLHSVHDNQKSLKWTKFINRGCTPCPRSDADMFYSPNTGKLTVFGGWSNIWHSDVYNCDVASIVGPTYNIFSIQPRDWNEPIGPVTGKTEMTLIGQGFSSVTSKSGTVRFICSKGFVDVVGEVIDDASISFSTPSFHKYGPVPVLIRLKIGPQSFANNSVDFKFFSVTSCTETVAFGPGLLDSNVLNEPTCFVIQTRDANGSDRSCGMDDFEVKIVHSKSRVEIPFQLKDVDDGSYIISYTPTLVGNFIISIKFLGTFGGTEGFIRGSPFIAKVVENGDTISNTLHGLVAQTFVNRSVEDLNSFVMTIEKAINIKVSKEDLKCLIAVKEHIKKLHQQTQSFETSISTVRAYLQFIKRAKLQYPQLEKTIRQFDVSSKSWFDVKRAVAVVKEKLTSADSLWTSKIKFKVEAYSKELKAIEIRFRGKLFWSSENPVGERLCIDDIQKSIHETEIELVREKRLMEENVYLCNCFGLDELIKPGEHILRDMQKDLELMQTVWKMHSDLENYISSVAKLRWNILDVDILDKEAKAQLKAVKSIDKRVHWSSAFQLLEKKTKDYLTTVPLISLLMSKAMRTRHWSALMKASNHSSFVSPSENPNTLLGLVLQLNLHTISGHVEEICDQAAKEEKIETNLRLIEMRWSQISFIVTPYSSISNKESEVPLLAIEEDDYESLENDQLSIQGILASRFVVEFKNLALSWQRALSNINEVYILISDIQRIWSYLEPLFIYSDEVKRELPEDTARFASIDENVQIILKTSWEIRNVNQACNREGLIENLEFIQEQLDLCKKSLGDFLDGRRRQFPRFYFVSEADLLDILSNGGNPQKILVHIPKIFLSTKTLILCNEAEKESGKPVAKEFVAGVGSEVCRFEIPVTLEGKVESYMQAVLEAQKLSIFMATKRSMMRYENQSRSEWILAKEDLNRPLDPAQSTLVVLAVNYVNEVESAFERISNGNHGAMLEYSEKQVQQLSDLIQLTQSNLSKGDRTKVMVCITMDAHSRDIVEKIIRNNVQRADSFMWQSQLKHKYRVPPEHARYQNRDPELRGENQERAEIAICDAIFPYDYEYLGNGPRLVITPLTDRIYVTATQALHLNMGCAPAGPAGTGKTETTKDLANALAKLIYVINCSPEMDYKGLGNIFKGVASSGAWVCFDEFNRLVPEVLSVCTVQFKSVCDGISSASPRIRVEGDEITLDPTCGAFITMNPGYLGRSELPEGLKALFRPMTVMVPDLILICENMLMAEGFVTAKSLASKFFCLYALLKLLLSAQLHYDWGLRAIKSVLVVAGSFKRAEPDLSEDALLMRALRDFNLPKIVRSDEVIFFGLLGDLFPGLDPPREKNECLQQYVLEACDNLGNDPSESFCLKVIQLEELLVIRHCVFVMGPAGAGKSQCLRTLKAARDLRDPSKITKIVDLNPKAVNTEELYGYISMASREWKDGLLSNIMRSMSAAPDESPKWIHLDGDLDANWIESMNSVMDDNRMLTLASNERIPLLPHMRMIFEIRDLKHATPATVSRAGILYISTEDGSVLISMVLSWINSKKDWGESKKLHVKRLFDLYVPKALIWLSAHTSSIVPIEEMSRVQALINMLDDFLEERTSSSLSEETIDMIFVYCAVWALGSSLCTSDEDIDSRKLFSDWWRQEFLRVKFPSRDTVFDYWLDSSTNNFEPWTKCPYFYEIQYDSTKMSMNQVTVPTSETSSVAYWMNLLVQKGVPVMLAGPAGTGKTQLVNGMLCQLDNTEYQSCTINFNFYTNAAAVRSNMMIPLEKKTGSKYGPSGNSKLIYFVDDMNLPEVDIYNTQSAIAQLRQHVEYEHFYDLQKMTLKQISNTQVISCMNPTVGSFHVNPRLQRWFTTFAIGLPGSTSLLTIYQTFLDGHLAGFNDEVKSISNNLIKAALGLHASISSTFKKTAANFHYEFNIRHISNVFQGFTVSKPSHFTSAEKLILLWLHESERVYGDRLVSDEDLVKYNTLVQSHCKKVFPSFPIAKYYAKENAELLLFCDFIENIENPVYDQVTCIQTMSKVIDEALIEYNETNPNMDLVLFDDAMKHITRIVRIIRNDGGHALLLGVGGSGKQSLARLSAYICGYGLYQIVISSTYSLSDFKEDLKIMCNRAGVKGESLLFLLTESQIMNERFMVYINDLLSSGNIPDLFTIDEVDAICSAVINRAKDAGFSSEKKECWNFFISQIRKNLHMCLCFSPVGDSFRNRAMKFPALINCTVIDIFKAWPEDALYSVAKKFLSDIDLGCDNHRRVIERFIPFSFQAISKAAFEFRKKERRHVYITPKSYLEFIKLFKHLLNLKRKNVDVSVNRLEHGLEKLRSTSESVFRLEKTLKVMLEDASLKKDKAAAIAAVVANEKASVEAETAKAQIERNEVARIAEEVSMKRKDTEIDLAKAEPAVQAAMEALDTLDQKDLSSCKGMLKPPPKLDEVFAATMCLLAGVMPTVVVTKSGKVKDTSWDAAKKQVMGNVKDYMTYLKDIKRCIDDNSIDPNNFREVRQYIEKDYFNVDTMKTKNQAAAGLCSFVLNIVSYYDIVVTVEPKRKALEEANIQLLEANQKLDAVMKHVSDLEEKLAKLNDDLSLANASKQEAIDAAEKGVKKLNLAQRLTNALANENERWAENINQLKELQKLLIGDVLIASAFVSYAGPFSKPFRSHLMNEVFHPFLFQEFSKGCDIDDEYIPISSFSNHLKIITSDADIAKWNADSLPADTVSVENAAICCSTARWPLLIDPQSQGIRWLKNKESKEDRILHIVRLGQKNLIQKLENALENGHTLIIENLGENIDAVLYPIIQRAVIKRGSLSFITVGDKECDFNPNFRLYLHTKLSNPHYPPEIQAELTLINFMVTSSGLEDQLLDLVVQKERPDLAKMNGELIKKQNLFTIRMKELEDNVLFKLSSAVGDITEDVALIEGLEETKMISEDIEQQSRLANETQISIMKTSEKYRGVARRSSLLFFFMNDLMNLHTYYVYNLEAFLEVFHRGINSAFSETFNCSPDGESHTDEELHSRCLNLNNSITATTFNYIRRGLLEKDKLTAAALLTFQIMTADGKIEPIEISHLTQDNICLDPGDMGDLKSWMPDEIWSKIKGLEVLNQFKFIGDDMQRDSDEWNVWFNSDSPESSHLPSGYEKKLNEFFKLILLRNLRPDRLLKSLRDFILHNMGSEFIEDGPFNMRSTYLESNNTTPIFFVLFPGVDPTPWIESLGEEMGKTKENKLFINISMGQGQEGPAEIMLKKSSKEGGWIVLQNCHLMSSWLPKLESILESIGQDAHEDFRCFISAEPPSNSSYCNMPESLLKSCIKVSNEAPTDIKSTLVRAWASFSQETIDECKKPLEIKCCLFALCWFHAVVCSRRRFGQIGWCRKYSFNLGDLSICANVLCSYLDGNDCIPWDDLRYIFGEIMYGGHITDAWDRRTCNSYLEVYLHDGLFKGSELAPSFRSPSPDQMSYKDYISYIETFMPEETPQMFGLHQNTEIKYLMASAENLLSNISSVTGERVLKGDEGGTHPVRDTIYNLLQRLPAEFEMFALNQKAKPLLSNPSGPYTVVALQECGRMNELLREMKRSLIDLEKGLNGSLNMTVEMEELARDLSMNSWPKAWVNIPSQKTLMLQFSDVIMRVEQLSQWTETFDIPKSIWLGGLFNPMSYITAALQVSARKSNTAMDKMTIETHMTQFSDKNSVQEVAEDGCYIHGLFMEGATIDDEGVLSENKKRDHLFRLPVIHLKAVPISDSWEPTSVGYLRNCETIYEAPCYSTTFRGPHYLFLGTLRTRKVEKTKWILAGVALFLEP